MIPTIARNIDDFEDIDEPAQAFANVSFSDSEDSHGSVGVGGNDDADVPDLAICHQVKKEYYVGHDAMSTSSALRFYLDVSSIISKDKLGVITSKHEEWFMTHDSSTFYIITEGDEHKESLCLVVNTLVEKLSSIVSSSSITATPAADNDELYWKPDVRTEKYLKQRHTGKLGNEEWAHILENEVLKWTASVHDNSQCSMLKTQGIIDMAPTDLKDLLLDCDRSRLFNKNLISKTNLLCFADAETGRETRIVRNVIRVPIVGITIDPINLTHVRCINDGGGYVLMSQSVSDDLSANTTNPFYSISLLRSVPSNEKKTEFTNISRLASSKLIPKFVLNKVGEMGAVDVFKNLRSMCK